NSLRKNPGTLAEERRATLDSKPGGEYRGGCRQNALVDVRTRSHLGFHAVAGRSGYLAHRHFHQFRPLRPFQRNRSLQFVRLRAVGFRRNSLDPGDVLALLWTDSDLQRAAARRPCASWAVAHETAAPVLVKIRRSKSETNRKTQIRISKSEFRHST